MTISSYKVESVLRAYSRQNDNAKGSSSVRYGDEPAKYSDTVTLSSRDGKAKAYEKISYGLLDIILRSEKQ